jgi:integrase/recombinase XerC
VLRRREKPITTRQLEKLVNRRSLAKIGRSIYPHQARHAFATHLIEGGADLQSVSQMAGHVNLDTTSRYIRVSQNLKRSAARRSTLWGRSEKSAAILYVR